MIKSMTGFGKGENTDNIRHFTVEIRSVNHRYNDIIVKMPKYLKSIEDNIIKNIRNRLSRGRIEVYINLKYLNQTDLDVKVDLQLANLYTRALEELSNHFNLDNNISLELLTRFPDIITTEKLEEDENEVWSCLKVAIDQALDNIIQMRINEGEELARDIRMRVDEIIEKIGYIQKRSPEVVIEYKEKLWKRINELLDDKYQLDESRLINEVAIFAEKSDINEEIVRLQSHMSQLLNILKSDEPVGRKLDFLLQEANREVNTIGSKTGDINITKEVIEIKSLLEKIREQVQNIE